MRALIQRLQNVVQISIAVYLAVENNFSLFLACMNVKDKSSLLTIVFVSRHNAHCLDCIELGL